MGRVDRKGGSGSLGCQFGSRLQLAIWKVPAAATRAASMERHSPLRLEAFFLEAGEELRLRAEGFLFLTVIRGRQALAAGRQIRAGAGSESEIGRAHVWTPVT